jgi:glucokinase
VLLGIDIGATKTQFVLGRAAGEVLGEARIESFASGAFEQDLATIAARAEALLREYGVAVSQLDAIGVSAPGPLDPVAGVIRDAPNLPGWHEVPIRAWLERAFGRPVKLENDANAAAVAEWRFGSGRGSRAFAFLTMSTGVGGGFVLDGRLYRGARYGAGEVGHMPVVPNGRLCACGLYGCLEAYTGGAALAARLRTDTTSGAAELAARAGVDRAKLRAEHWVAALRQGDSYATALADEYLDTLAQAVAILIQGFDFDAIAFGTIVARNTDLLLEPLRARVATRVWARLATTRLEPAQLGKRLPSYAGLCAAMLDPVSGSLSSA